jgi:[calcium/calmodulin-dependent protein kinase] kinase
MVDFQSEISSDMLVYDSYGYNKTMIDNRKIVNDVFEVLEQIGDGSYWKVYKVQRDFESNDGTDHNYYVFKEGQYSKVDGEDMKEIPDNDEELKETKIGMKEYYIMRRVNNSNIARLYECIIDIDKDKIVLVMEFCDMGTLMNVNETKDRYLYNYNIINHILNEVFNSEPLNEDELITFKNNHSVLTKLARYIFKHVANGLKYLHNRNICHRDLKPNNIVYKSSDKQIKIIDFSISKRLPSNEKKISNTQGTDYFSPPNLHNFESYDPFKVDIYSFGASIYVFLFNNFDFNLSDSEEIAILRNEYSDLYDLLTYCLDLEPDNRPDIDDVVYLSCFQEDI